MKIGTVCRFKPLHLVHASMLRSLCRLSKAGQSGAGQAEAGQPSQLLIGVGSSNVRSARNPFSFEETQGMIDALLAPEFDHYEVLPVPDLGHGPRWRAQVQRLMGPLDLFVTANDYVWSLLQDTYRLAHPRELIPLAERRPLCATDVREAIARGEPWEHLCPPAVTDYLTRTGLTERFRREFGLATLVAGSGLSTRPRAHLSSVNQR